MKQRSRSLYGYNTGSAGIYPTGSAVISGPYVGPSTESPDSEELIWREARLPAESGSIILFELSCTLQCEPATKFDAVKTVGRLGGATAAQRKLTAISNRPICQYAIDRFNISAENMRGDTVRLPAD